MDNGQPTFSDKRLPLEERWATVQDLADLYSMSADSVRNKAKSGEWPCHRQGKTIRFSPYDQSRIEDMWVSSWEDRPWTKEDRDHIRKLLSEH